MLHDLAKRCLVTFLAVQMLLPPSLWAEGGYSQRQEYAAHPQSEQAPLPAELEEIVTELEQADEHTPVGDIPDPFHLTQQYLLVMRGDGNSSDSYHLAGTEGGLPPVLPQPKLVKAVSFDGKLALRYKHVAHVVESLAPAIIAYDRELLVTVTSDGEVYAIDMTFARREAFKAPLPVHKLPLVIESDDLSGMQAGFITRGFNPFTHMLTEQGEVQPLSPTSRFTAGDLVLWREVEGRRVLINKLARDFIVTAINNGNHLLGSLAAAFRKDRPLALQSALIHERQQGQHVDKQQLDTYRQQSSVASEQVLQNMDVKRLHKMLLDDIQLNTYRDDFTYSHWQRDYLLLKKQAEVTIEKLNNKLIKDGTTRKHIAALERQLQQGDLGASWIMLSKLYVKESKELLIDKINTLKHVDTPAAREKITKLEEILANNDFQRLWNEPQLLTATEETLSPARLRVNRFFYQQLSRDNLRHLAANVLGIGALGVASYATLRALKTGFSIWDHLIPAPFRVKDVPIGSALESGTSYVSAIRIDYNRYLVIATALGVGIIAAVAAVGWLTARSSGEDWNFQRQLTLMGIRAYATLSQPFWHYLANVAGQKTLMPSLAAKMSPFTTVHGNTALGESIGLAPSESVRVGWQPFSAQAEDDESLRRRAIAVLQQQRARAQGLGYEMATKIIWRDWLQGQQRGESGVCLMPVPPRCDWRQRQPNLDYFAYEDLVAVLEQSDFQRRWKIMAVGLEEEISTLQRQGVFPDLRTVNYEKVHDFISRTQPHLLEFSYHEDRWRRASRTVRDVGSKALAFFATAATDNINFLRTADPDDFVASEIWRSFMIDFFTVVALEGTVASRSKVFGSADDLQSLVATNKFPFMHLQHRFTITDQIYAYQVRGQGRYSLIFQTLEKIEESNYTPLEATLLGGKENPQSFAAGLLDLASNSLDVRNTDYGSRYVRDLEVTFFMMQSAILGAIFNRAIVAKVAVGSVLPQFFYKLFWGMWGYAWPWIIYYSSSRLRETKHTTRLGMLMQAKVQLRKAIDRDDANGMQNAYQALVDVYRSFAVGVPPLLKREVELVEDDLRIAHEERLSSLELLPRMASLVQMAESDNPVVKREIYRRLAAQVDGGQQASPLSRAEAEGVLKFVMLNPPFPTSLDGKVNYLGVIIGAVTTTIMASWFFRGGFKFTRFREVIPYVVGGSAVYTSVWLLFKKEHARKMWNFVREDVLGYPPDRAAQY